MTDSQGISDVAILTVTIQGADDNPVFTSPATATIQENTTSVLTLVATDVDSGDVPSFSVTGGADSSKFQVFGNQLVFSSQPDFENPTDADHNNVYQVQVTADDGHGGQTMQTINVTVTDAADSSVFIDGSGNLVIGASTGQNDAYRLSYNGNIVLTATSGGPFFSTVGTGSGTNTLSIVPNSFSGRIIVNTGDGDDTLTVDTSLVAAGKNVDFNGGGGTDTLALTGSIDTQRYGFTNSSSGSVTLDPDGNIGAQLGITVNYTGLSPINSTIVGSNVELNYAGGAETIAVTDATGGKTTVGSTQGETVTFVNPTNSFKLSAANGVDTININSLAANYSAIQISGDSADDALNVNTPVSLVFNNSFSATNFAAVNINNGTTNGSITTTGIGEINLSTNALGIGSAANLTTGASGTVTIDPVTPSLAINLGGADNASQLGLTNVELNRISTISIVLGDTSAHSGAVTVSSAISITPSLALQWLGTATNITLNVNAALTTGPLTTTGLDIANLNANITATGGITGDATTVTVDDNPSGQIQDGIDIAAAGAQVNVQAGSYNESLAINKNLNLVAQNNSIVAT